jgi:hypothetical protein
MRRFVLAIAAVFLTVIPIAALADSYTYNISVPATATNLPAGSQLQVTCILYSGANGSGQSSSQSSQLITVTGTKYSGTFRFPTLGASFPAASYTCSLVAFGSGGSRISLVNPSSPKFAPGWSGTWQTSANF